MLTGFRLTLHFDVIFGAGTRIAGSPDMYPPGTTICPVPGKPGMITENCPKVRALTVNKEDGFHCLGPEAGYIRHMFT